MDASLPTTQAQPGTQQKLVNTALEPNYFYQNDLLLVTLRDKLRINLYTLMLIVMILTGGVLFGAYALSGLSFNALGFAIRALILTFIAFPILAWLYYSLPQHIATLFNTLEKNKVIGQPRAKYAGTITYDDYLRHVMAAMDHLWWIAGSLSFVVLYWLYRLLLVDPGVVRPYPLWLRIAILLVYAPMFYSCVLTIVRLLVTLYFTNKLFEVFDIQINPLHPDGSAGLGFLGDMLNVSVLFMIMLGVSSLTMNTSFLFGTPNTFSVVEAVIMAVFYINLSLLLIFGWLKVPHEAMQAATNEQLQSLSEEFQRALVETQPVEGADAAAIKEGNDRLDQLKRRYQLIQDTYPVWPVEIVRVRRLVGAISLPALFTLLWPLLSKYIPMLIQFPK